MDLKKIIYGLILAFLILIPGCIKEDLSDCGITVHFTYTRNLSYEDKFTENIDQVSLFLFDGNGVFLEEYTRQAKDLNDQSMDISLLLGDYQLVAWGNLNENYEIIPSFIKGETKIEDAILTLNRIQDTVKDFPTPLFYAGVAKAKIESPYPGRKTVEMDFMKNTNAVHIRAKGLPIDFENPEDSNEIYEFKIVSTNGNYTFYNTVLGNPLTYIPTNSVDVENKIYLSDFVILRELNDKSTDSRLVITRKKNGQPEEVLFNIDLEDELIKYSKRQGRDGDLDREDDFILEIDFNETHGAVTITINGWESIEGGGSIG